MNIDFLTGSVNAAVCWQKTNNLPKLTVLCFTIMGPQSLTASYFNAIQVIDTHPIPGMVISPKEGVVPVGGTAELTVRYLNQCCSP